MLKLPAITGLIRRRPVFDHALMIRDIPLDWHEVPAMPLPAGA